MDVLSGGVLIACAAVLWIVYLLPVWVRRHQYLATDRNAVRLQQTLRILAETAETPMPVRLEATARTVAAQQRILREQRVAERLAAEAAANHAVAQRKAAERLVVLTRREAALQLALGDGAEPDSTRGIRRQRAMERRAARAHRRVQALSRANTGTLAAAQRRARRRARAILIAELLLSLAILGGGLASPGPAAGFFVVSGTVGVAFACAVLPLLARVQRVRARRLVASYQTVEQSLARTARSTTRSAHDVAESWRGHSPLRVDVAVEDDARAARSVPHVTAPGIRRADGAPAARNIHGRAADRNSAEPATDGWMPQKLPLPVHVTREMIAAATRDSVAPPVRMIGSSRSSRDMKVRDVSDAPRVTSTAGAELPIAFRVATNRAGAESTGDTAGVGASALLASGSSAPVSSGARVAPEPVARAVPGTAVRGSVNPYASMGVIGDPEPGWNNLNDVLARRRAAS